MIRGDRIASSATRCALSGSNVIVIGSPKTRSRRIVKSSEGLTNPRTLHARLLTAAPEVAAALTLLS
jgi:hypothetical protein